MRTTTTALLIFLSTFAGCVGNQRPEVAACMELEALTLPLCERVNANSAVQLDCRARFFGEMGMACTNVEKVRDFEELEMDCLPTMRAARLVLFTFGGGWYDWPESCRSQFIFSTGI